MIKNKKGFTLVEALIVMVILSILMAVAVPSVYRYLDEADEEKYYAQARSVLMVLETRASRYKMNNLLTDTVLYEHRKEIIGAANVTGELLSVTPCDTGNLIKEFVYKIYGENKSVIYRQENDEMTIVLNYQSLGDSDAIESLGDVVTTEGMPNTLDSEAAKIEGSNASKVVEQLKQDGMDLAAMGAKSWHIEKNTNLHYIIWSEEEIADKEDGSVVVVMRYNFTGTWKGLYTVWKAEVKTETRLGADKPYKVLSIMNNTEYTSHLTFDEKKVYSNVYKIYQQNK